MATPMEFSFSGASSQTLNQSAGGNAGITFAPKGITPVKLALIATGALAAWLIWKRSK